MQDQHELTMAEAVDVMEDVARFMNACARWRHQDHVFFAGPDRGIDHAKELASCGVIDRDEVLATLTPMRCIQMLWERWRNSPHSERAINAEAVACNLWPFMQQFCGTPQDRAVAAIQGLVDEIKGGVAEVLNIEESTEVRTVHGKEWINGYRPGAQRTMHVTFRVIDKDQ